MTVPVNNTQEKTIFNRYHIEDLQQIAAEFNVPLLDVVGILLNVNGAAADPTIKRIRGKIKLNNSDMGIKNDEWFYFGLANRTRSHFQLTDEHLYFVSEDGAERTDLGNSKEVENDDCASSYFRKNNTVLTMNTNKRSVCVGCKFCPNTLQLNAAEHLLTSKEEIKTYLLGLANKLGHSTLGFLEEMAHCTGCYGSEEKCLNAIMTILEAARELGFRGRFHYIGSEIKSREAMTKIRENCEEFWITFSIECFTKRDQILKNLKAENALGDYKLYMKRAWECDCNVSYIYVLGLDDLASTVKHMNEFAGYTTRFPIVNIFQPHEEAHYALMDPAATAGLGYYLNVRKELERIYKNDPHCKPQSWNCYRPLWYTQYQGKPLNCIRM